MTTLVMSGVHQSKGSPVWEAWFSGDKKLAKKLFDENTKKYETQFSKEDRDWFAATAKEFARKADEKHKETCQECK